MGEGGREGEGGQEKEGSRGRETESTGGKGETFPNTRTHILHQLVLMGFLLGHIRDMS